MINPINKIQDEDGIQKDTAANVASTDNMAAQEASGTLDRQTQDALGRRLQQVYGRLVAEPLPDKVIQLLAKLASRDTAASETEPRPKTSGEGEK